MKVSPSAGPPGSEQRFGELARQIRCVLWVATPDELLYVSPAYEEIWGRSSRSLYEDRASWMESVHPEDMKRVRLAIIGSLKKMAPASTGFRIIRFDGTIRWVLARFFTILEQGRPILTVGTAEDLTALRQAEEIPCLERDLALRLGAAGDVAKAMQCLLEACLRFAELDSGAIYVAEQGAAAPSLICQVGLSDVFLGSTSFHEQLSCHAHLAAKGAAHWCAPLVIPEMEALLQREGILAFLALPVLYRGEVVSLLYLGSHAQNQIPEDIKAAVEVFATQTGRFIPRVRLADALKAQSEALQETNAALKVLLKQREEDRKELETSLLRNVKHLIRPYLEKLKKSRLAEDQKNLVAILESHLQEITSPFARNISAPLLALTPTEIRVADLIRQGKSSKEIARLLGISGYAVVFHRQGIRRKLGLTGKKLNLQTHLSRLE